MAGAEESGGNLKTGDMAESGRISPEWGQV